MSTSILNLQDRIITDTGSMIAKYNLLVKLALNKEQFDHLPFVYNDDVARYHHDHGTIETAKSWHDDGKYQGPSKQSYSWMYPDEYNDVDIEELCLTTLTERDLVSDDYVIRLSEELMQIEHKKMTNFFKCLIWVTDTLRKHDLVWGLGRGSSCASLVLFLLGVNKVDPIKYDIPMEEFYK